MHTMPSTRVDVENVVCAKAVTCVPWLCGPFSWQWLNAALSETDPKIISFLSEMPIRRTQN